MLESKTSQTRSKSFTEDAQPPEFTWSSSLWHVCVCLCLLVYTLSPHVPLWSTNVFSRSFGGESCEAGLSFSLQSFRELEQVKARKTAMDTWMARLGGCELFLRKANFSPMTEVTRVSSHFEEPCLSQMEFLVDL